MKKAAFIPCPGHTFDTLFGFSGDVLYKEGSEMFNMLYHRLLGMDIELCEFSDNADNYDAVIYLNALPISVLEKVAGTTWIYMGFEPSFSHYMHVYGRLERLSNIFDYVITTNRHDFNKPNILRLKAPAIVADLESPNDPIRFENKKLACMIATVGMRTRNKKAQYYHRKTIADYFQKIGGEDIFAMYGRGWDEDEYSNVYKGVADDKKTVYQEYRFAFSLNNDTEVFSADKLFDCIRYGIVPIGNYAEFDIPRDIYIEYGDFDGMDALYERLRSMDKDEWLGYIERGRAFLKTDGAQQYDISVLAEYIRGAVYADVPARVKTRRDIATVKKLKGQAWREQIVHLERREIINRFKVYLSINSPHVYSIARRLWRSIAGRAKI
jgi:hypothetical protein